MLGKETSFETNYDHKCWNQDDLLLENHPSKGEIGELFASIQCIESVSQLTRMVHTTIQRAGTYVSVKCSTHSSSLYPGGSSLLDTPELT